MDKKRPGIVFMGTPQFAVPSLEILVSSGYPVKAVVTAPDRPSGRGLKVRGSAVKTAATSLGIPILQPVNLKDQLFVNKLASYSADIFVVVAFRMLPEKVWSLPSMGTFNLHASLLPLYRGAAPINHAIINGEKTTGVTTFFINHEIDKGEILYRDKVDIHENDTAGTLHDRLMTVGAGLVLKTVEAISAGMAEPLSQDEIILNDGLDSLRGKLPDAPKISRDDCRINWQMPADRIYDFVRGLSPFPSAWTTMDTGEKSIKIKILEVGKDPGYHPNNKPGQIQVVDNQMIVSSLKGSVIIKTIQAEGKKAMTAPDFLRGLRTGTSLWFR